MTLLLVVALDLGILLVVSAWENHPLRQTFTDIVNNTVTPAEDNSITADARTNASTPGSRLITETPNNPQRPPTAKQ